MSLILRLYLNTSLATVILFSLLAFWGVVNAIRNSALTPNYHAALIISQLPLFALCLFYIGLRLAGLLTDPMRLPLMYHGVALLVFPWFGLRGAFSVVISLLLKVIALCIPYGLNSPVEDAPALSVVEPVAPKGLAIPLAVKMLG